LPSRRYAQKRLQTSAHQFLTKYINAPLQHAGIYSIPQRTNHPGISAATRQLQQLDGCVASSSDDSHNDNDDKNKHINQTVHGRGRRMPVVTTDNKQQQQRQGTMLGRRRSGNTLWLQ